MVEELFPYVSLIHHRFHLIEELNKVIVFIYRWEEKIRLELTYGRYAILKSLEKRTKNKKKCLQSYSRVESPCLSSV
ncbi:MAG: hypothetical protein OXC92_08980 [Flavobacteriaceae bacterium]|nr:hypothetical protein [Flavobacteriaceae bacterium]